MASLAALGKRVRSWPAFHGHFPECARLCVQHEVCITCLSSFPCVFSPPAWTERVPRVLALARWVQTHRHKPASLKVLSRGQTIKHISTRLHNTCVGSQGTVSKSQRPVPPIKLLPFVRLSPSRYRGCLGPDHSLAGRALSHVLYDPS